MMFPLMTPTARSSRRFDWLCTAGRSVLCLAAAVAPPAFAQSVEVLLDEGVTTNGFGRVAQVAPIAVNDSGSWVAFVWGTITDGLAVDGVAHLREGDLLPTGEQIRGIFDPCIDGHGRVATAVWLDSGPVAILLNGIELIRAGADAGAPGATWNNLRVAGIADTGRIFLWGSTLDSNQVNQRSIGYIDVDLSGAVVGRGLIAHGGLPLPHNLGQLVSIEEIAVSSSGSLLWQGKRDSGSSSDDEFLILDNTLLAVEGDPSPVNGQPWQLGSVHLSLSPDGLHWSIAGWLALGPGSQNYAVVVDGALRYGASTSLPGIAPYSVSPPRVAWVDNAGSVFWAGDVTAPDDRFGHGLFFDDDVVYWSGTDEIGGQTTEVNFATLSADRRYCLGNAVRPGSQALVILDRFGAPIPCGTTPDPYEPNDTCGTATLLAYEGALCTATRGVDEDWYVIAVNANEIVGVQALQSGLEGEVDIEVFAGDCSAMTPLVATFQDSPDEGLVFQNPLQVSSRFFVRVAVPADSPSACSGYALRFKRNLSSACTPALSPDDAFEPNDSYSSATPLALGRHAGLFASSYARDFYRITVPPMANAYVTASTPSFSSLRMGRIDEGSRVMRSSLSVGPNTSASLLNSTTSPKQFVIEVFFEDALFCTTYDLEITLPGASVGSIVCTGVPNSTGLPATLSASGNAQVLIPSLSLLTEGLPPGSGGHYLASPAAPLVTLNPGGSDGNLCLGHPIGRMITTLQTANFEGQAWSNIDVTQIPTPTGSTAVVAGSTWTFQFWYRDAAPGSTSNFSSALSVTFI